MLLRVEEGEVCLFVFSTFPHFNLMPYVMGIKKNIGLGSVVAAATPCLNVDPPMDP